MLERSIWELTAFCFLPRKYSLLVSEAGRKKRMWQMLRQHDLQPPSVPAWDSQASHADWDFGLLPAFLGDGLA